MLKSQVETVLILKENFENLGKNLYQLVQDLAKYSHKDYSKILKRSYHVFDKFLIRNPKNLNKIYYKSLKEVFKNYVIKISLKCTSAFAIEK